MSGFENRIATLLQDAVPEPGHDIDVATVERLGRRRRAAVIAAPVVAAVVAILAVVAAVTIAGRSDKPVQPATPVPTTSTTTTTKTATLDLGGISLRYPSNWHTARIGRAHPVHAIGGDPTAFLTSDAVTSVCQRVVPSGQYCQKGVALLSGTGVYAGYDAFEPDGSNSGSLDLTLDTKVAGRPASVDEDFNVNGFCPTGTASTTEVVAKVSPTKYLSIIGCLGSSPSAAKTFKHLLDTARYTP